jgi:hypothetical protein
VGMLSKHFDDQWKLLQQLKPTSNQKEAMRKRIWESIQHHPDRSRKSFIPWKNILATGFLLLICGSFLLFLLLESTQPQFSEGMSIGDKQFSWDLKDVYSKNTDHGLALYREGQAAVQVGAVQQITEEEMNRIIHSVPMFVYKKLENFPYPTSMYIEHVKMMDVLIRYHFFIPLTDEKVIYFTFEYPKLDHAEIFQAVSTLRIEGIKPYTDTDQLYVTHGYGTLIYPVGLEPISISPNKEVYHWEGASIEAFNAYIKKIEEGHWEKKATTNQSHTFVSASGNEEVTITIEGETITYEFFYPNRDQ